MKEADSRDKSYLGAAACTLRANAPVLECRALRRFGLNVPGAYLSPSVGFGSRQPGGVYPTWRRAPHFKECFCTVAQLQIEESRRSARARTGYFDATKKLCSTWLRTMI